MERTAQIEVRELKPELLSDYLKFFDKAFSDFPHWAGCYCGFYDTPGNDWDATAEAGPEHRAARSERINKSRAQGLLAYIDDEPVGWCNAQPRASFANMRSYRVAVTDPDEPVGSIMCFLVAPEHRGKGVCTALLKAACDKFHRDGLQVAEGLPCHEPFETCLGDSMGRRELQGTPESLLDERFQDSSTARKVRDRKKTGLSLHSKSHAAKTVWASTS